MKHHVVRGVVLCCGLIAIASVSRPAEGLEVGAFSIEKYELAYDDCAGGVSVDWKDEIDVSVQKDAFGASEGVGFFEAMNPPGTCQYCNCSGAGCATPTNRTFANKNDSVTPSTMASRFNKPDLVFFYGHNITLESAQFYMDIPVWTPTNNWRGCKQSIPEHFWGTMIFPYYYQESPVFDANYEHNSYPVFYGYNNFTSIIFGKDFIPGTWYTEDSYEQSTAQAWSGNLGSNVNWFIGNGCRALPMADYTIEPHDDPRPFCDDDSDCPGNQICQRIDIYPNTYRERCTTPCTSSSQCASDWNVDPTVIWCGTDPYHGGNYCQYSYGQAYLINLSNLTVTWWEEHPVPQGIYGWWPSWGNMHMVLGHYYSISPGAEPNAVNIATDLKAGALVKDAYFDNHGFEEYWDQVQPGWGEPAALKAVQDGGPDYFASDTWTSPQADPTNLDGFGIAYRVNVSATIYYRNYVIVD